MKMRELCRKIIRERLENPKPDAKDLLSVMLHGVDKGSGEKLGVENVMYRYKTTSSTTCFIYYFLCSKPDTLRKAQQEVGEFVGDRVLTYVMLRILKYIDTCMKETLCMQHPVSILT